MYVRANMHLKHDHKNWHKCVYGHLMVHSMQESKSAGKQAVHVCACKAAMDGVHPSSWTPHVQAGWLHSLSMQSAGLLSRALGSYTLQLFSTAEYPISGTPTAQLSLSHFALHRQLTVLLRAACCCVLHCRLCTTSLVWWRCCSPPQTATLCCQMRGTTCCHRVLHCTS